MESDSVGERLARLEKAVDKVLERLEPRPALLSLAATAQLLSLSARTVARLVASGELRTVRVGERVLVPAGEVERLAASATGAKAPRARPSPPPRHNGRATAAEVRAALRGR